MSDNVGEEDGVEKGAKFPEGADSIPLFAAHLKVPRSPDVFAATLRERILAREFPPGMALPPERDLAAQAGMSRTTVRSALKILEAQGLVSIRPGRAGGTFVRQPRTDTVVESIDILIRGRQIALGSLLEVREAFEPPCAGLAARNRTEADLSALLNDLAMMEEAGPLDEFLDANIGWHGHVAIATDNELLVAFMSAISKAIHAATVKTKFFIDEEVRSLTLRAHRAVTEAIVLQDEERAVRRMARHVHAYSVKVEPGLGATGIELSDAYVPR